MTYLFFDTETTGLPRRWSAPPDDVGNWPRIVQIAWLLCDAEKNVIAREDRIIRPEGYVISEMVSRIHGITHEKALSDGVPIERVLPEFVSAVERAGAVVAHNMQFDENIVAAECIRAGIANVLGEKRKICTMLSAVDYCRLPGRYGSYKWPKLEELHTRLFGPGFQETHNAADDVATCVKCFFELKERGIICEALEKG